MNEEDVSVTKSGDQPCFTGQQASQSFSLIRLISNCQTTIIFITKKEIAGVHYGGKCRLLKLNFDSVKKLTVPTYNYQTENGAQVLILNENFYDFLNSKDLLD